MAKRILQCPECRKVLYKLEGEPFVTAGACRYCKTLIQFNPQKERFERTLEGGK